MKTSFLALLIATLPAAAFAHVVIQPGAAAPGQIVETKVIVGHGCSGQPTTAVHIAVPASVGMVHVMETPGWTAKADKTGEATTAVTWTADDGKGTADAQTFLMHVEMPKTVGRILFPAVQTCGAVSVGWDDKTKDHPAPSINVGGPAAPAADMSHMDHGEHH